MKNKDMFIDMTKKPAIKNRIRAFLLIRRVEKEVKKAKKEGRWTEF